MANPKGGTQNLDPVRTKEEAKRRGRNGGIASGKARRRKRSMMEAAELLMNMPISQDSVASTLKAMGFNDEDLTNQMAVLVAMLRESLQGNVSAATFLRDTKGDKAEHIQHKEEFEYRKERDAGISQEMEDMDEIEEEIYGTDEAKL